MTQNYSLIIVDPQIDFISGSLAVNNAEEIFEPILSISNKFENIFVTQDYHPKEHISFASTHNVELFSTIELPYGKQVMWPDHCVQGTKGVEFDDSINQIKNKTIIKKGLQKDLESYSGFHLTELKESLTKKNIEKIFVCGLATDFCVKKTAMDGVKEGFQVYVLLDCSRGVAEKTVNEAIEEMKNKGITFINTTELDEHLN
ncbi:hypothetical protein M0813_01024 [Anaeramoeba flamelloides]|uniref:nicotinamidase n=1 Tax=Anaeramoeba flamelloides TaxID=1746091 RepID=A0ABQ8X0P9_9EUKA|nr:hypothetical protein M0813_01024 [Anaeramoeba flamelloides]